MIPFPSVNFQNALQTDFVLTTKFEIWQPGATAATFQSINSYPSIAITDGNVTYTKSSDCRSQCSVTVVSPDVTLVPTLNSSLLTPFGNEIRVFSGITYPSGLTEWVPLGAFRISQVLLDEENGFPKMTITGYDRSHNISRNVVLFYWPDPLTALKIYNQNWANLIQIALSDRWPAVQFSGTVAQWQQQFNDQVNDVVPNGFNTFSEGTDLWSQMRQYAQAGGCDMFFNRYGIVTLYRDPNYSFMSANNQPAPTASFIEGTTCTFDKIQRTLDDSGVYNVIVVYGEGTILGTPLFNYPPNGQPAMDNDPNSPTWVGPLVKLTGDTSGFLVPTGQSPYGLVPNIITNNLLVSQQQVNDFANLQLVVSIGAEESVSIPSIAINPCLEVDDVVQVQRLIDGIPANTLYIIDSLTMPLIANTPMQMTLRQKHNLTLPAA